MASKNEATEMTCSVDPYCLGMCSWTDCSGNADVAINYPEPHPEPEPLPLPSTETSNEPHPTSGCFAIASEQELAKLAEGLVPLNTSKTTKWAINNFQEWMTNQNQVHPYRPSTWRYFSVYRSTGPQHSSIQIRC